MCGSDTDIQVPGQNFHPSFLFPNKKRYSTSISSFTYIEVYASLCFSLSLLSSSILQFSSCSLVGQIRVSTYVAHGSNLWRPCLLSVVAAFLAHSLAAGLRSMCLLLIGWFCGYCCFLFMPAFSDWAVLDWLVISFSHLNLCCLALLFNGFNFLEKLLHGLHLLADITWCNRVIDYVELVSENATDVLSVTSLYVPYAAALEPLGVCMVPPWVVFMHPHGIARLRPTVYSTGHVFSWLEL